MNNEKINEVFESGTFKNLLNEQTPVNTTQTGPDVNRARSIVGDIIDRTGKALDFKGRRRRRMDQDLDMAQKRANLMTQLKPFGKEKTNVKPYANLKDSDPIKKLYMTDLAFQKLSDKLFAGEDLTGPEQNLYDLKIDSVTPKGPTPQEKAKQTKAEFQRLKNSEIRKLDPDLRTLLAAREMVNDYIEYKIDPKKDPNRLAHHSKSEFINDIIDVLKVFIYGGEINQKDGMGSVIQQGNPIFKSHRQDKNVFDQRFERDIMNKLIPEYLPDRDRTIIANKIKASYDEEISKLKDDMPSGKDIIPDEIKDKKQKLSDDAKKKIKKAIDKEKSKKEETKLSSKAIKTAVSKISSGMRERAKKVGIVSPEKYVENIFKKEGKQPLSKPDNVRRRYLNVILKVERDNQDNALGLSLEKISFEDKLQSILHSLLSKDIITK